MHLSCISRSSTHEVVPALHYCCLLPPTPSIDYRTGIYGRRTAETSRYGTAGPSVNGHHPTCSPLDDIAVTARGAVFQPSDYTAGVGS